MYKYVGLIQYIQYISIVFGICFIFLPYALVNLSFQMPYATIAVAKLFLVSPD